jgi:hypothetical protein
VNRVLMVEPCTSQLPRRLKSIIGGDKKKVIMKGVFIEMDPPHDNFLKMMALINEVGRIPLNIMG